MKRNSKLLRTLSALAVIALVCLGLAIHSGTGTPSAWGIYDIAAICPLGAVEAAIAAKTVVPPLLIAAGIAFVLVVIFGRAFCAWGCPVPLLRRIFGLKSPEEKKAAKEAKAKGAGITQVAEAKSAQVAEAATASGSGFAAAAQVDRPASAASVPGDQAQESPAPLTTAETGGSSAPLAPATEALKPGILDIPNNKRGGVADSRNWVLGGTILSTALFGFPVFCLICPVGLTFATIIAFWRLFQFNEVVLSLVIFPVILVLEVVVLRKWCSRFCPLGALLSLVSRLNRTFRPKSNESACLHTAKGEACHKCVDVCPEGINLHDTTVSAPLNECTKCRACADACPMHAISFPFLPKAVDKQEALVEPVEDAKVNG